MLRVLPTSCIIRTVQSSPYSWYFWHCSEVFPTVLLILLPLFRVIHTPGISGTVQSYPTPGISGTVHGSPYSWYYCHWSEFSLLPILLALLSVLPTPGITGTFLEYSLLSVLLALFRFSLLPVFLALSKLFSIPCITGTVQSYSYSQYC
jgi:hypothetical protein